MAYNVRQTAQANAISNRLSRQSDRFSHRTQSEFTLLSRLADQSHNRRTDVTGMLLSIGCAIHCAVTPVLLSFAPIIGISTVGGLSWFTSPVVHQLAAVVCCVLMAKALAPRWKKRIDGFTNFMAGSGVVLLLTAAFILPDPCCPTNDVLSWIGAPLLSASTLQAWFGNTISHYVITSQPYLTPLGGLFLVGAHAMNLDAIRRESAKACCV